MTPKLIAILIFTVFLGALAIFFAYFGRLSFWKLVQKYPFDGLAFFEEHEAWRIVPEGNDPPGADYVGPFIFVEPHAGQRLRLYANEAIMEESQTEFIETHPDLIQPYMFPWLSALAILYPVFAMNDLGNYPATTLSILGYGLANLGYVMAGGALLTGSFRILGMDTRAQTFVAALIFWVIGTILSNL